MKPQVELHSYSVYIEVDTKGAEETFEDAEVITITNNKIPEGVKHQNPSPCWWCGGVWEKWQRDPIFWNFMFMNAVEDMDGIPIPPHAGIMPPDSGELAEVERVRQFFPETWLWKELITDEQGNASLTEEVPDTITTWMLNVVGLSQEKGLGIGGATLRAFQPFFIKIDLPYSAIRGGEFPVSVSVYNYLGTKLDVFVEIETAYWFDLLDDTSKMVPVEANDIGGVQFKIRPKKLGIKEVKVTARSSDVADAMIKQIIIEPEGVNYSVTNDGSGNLSGYAWAENAGWINFSCENTGTCDTVEYGATIDPATGAFSGHAWGENIGWITLRSTAPVPFGVTTIDADRLPDAWEQQIINADPNDLIKTIGDVRPGDDFDKDGGNNLQEYLAGTDPTDPSNSPPPPVRYEDFETGDLRRFPWVTTGADVWSITKTSNHTPGGMYAAETPALDDTQSAALEVRMYCEEGDISFWYAVSSEQNHDLLHFYIDDTEQNAWSGEVPLSQATFAVPAGMHIFRWVYTKNKFDASGGDTASVDDISFPMGIDSDYDGMPDGWETDNGLDPWFNDAQDDADGGGLINLEEYKAGLDPLDSSDDPIFNLSLPSGWSMISLPINPIDKKLQTLFPEAVVVYGHDKEKGYVRVGNHENLTVGRSYWILLAQGKTYTFTGQPIPSYTRAVPEEGWYMIGGCTSPAQATVVNGHIVVIYGHGQERGYQQVGESEHLEPGQGYWILISDTTAQTKLRVEAIPQRKSAIAQTKVSVDYETDGPNIITVQTYLGSELSNINGNSSQEVKEKIRSLKLKQSRVQLHIFDPKYEVLIVNPGFEQEAGNNAEGGWTAGNSTKGIFTWDNRVSHSGGYSVSITKSRGDTAWTQKDFISVNPSTQYTSSAWIKLEATAPESTFIRINWYNESQVWIHTDLSSKVGGTQDWSYLSLITISPQNAAYAKIQLVSMWNWNTAWFDDVTFGMWDFTRLDAALNLCKTDLGQEEPIISINPPDYMKRSDGKTPRYNEEYADYCATVVKHCNVDKQIAPNSSFETGDSGDSGIPEGWITNSTKGYFTWDDNVSHSGGYSVAITNSRGDIAWIQKDFIPVNPSTQYTSRAWIKLEATAPESTFIRVMWYNEKHSWIHTDMSNKVGGTQDWSCLSLTTISPPSAFYAKIQLVSMWNWNTAWFDDCMFYEDLLFTGL